MNIFPERREKKIQRRVEKAALTIFSNMLEACTSDEATAIGPFPYEESVGRAPRGIKPEDYADRVGRSITRYLAHTALSGRVGYDAELTCARNSRVTSDQYSRPANDDKVVVLNLERTQAELLEMASN